MQEILVKVGDPINEGQELIKVDDHEAKTAVLQAELEKKAADQQISQLNVNISSLNKQMFGGGLQALKKRSAVYWAGKIHTPLLLLHAGEDPKVDVRDSTKLYTRLSNAYNALIVYPSNRHDIRDFKQSVSDETKDWFDSFIK